MGKAQKCLLTAYLSTFSCPSSLASLRTSRPSRSLPATPGTSKLSPQQTLQGFDPSGPRPSLLHQQYLPFY